MLFHTKVEICGVDAGYFDTRVLAQYVQHRPEVIHIPQLVRVISAESNNNMPYHSVFEAV